MAMTIFDWLSTTLFIVLMIIISVGFWIIQARVFVWPLWLMILTYCWDFLFVVAMFWITSTSINTNDVLGLAGLWSLTVLLRLLT